MSMTRSSAMAIVAAFAVATVASAACTANTPDTKGSSGSRTAPGAATSQTATPTRDAGAGSGKVQLGEPVTVGDWSIMVRNPPRSEPMYSGNYPKKGNEYVVITVGLENKGSAPAKLAASDFKLMGEDGKSFPLVAGGASQWIDGMDPMKPGAATGLGIIYEVPINTGKLDLVIEPKGASEPKVIVLK